MAASVTCTDIVNRADRTFARFTVGNQSVELEIPGGTIAERRAFVFSQVRDDDGEFLCWLMLALFLRRFPNPTAAQVNAFKTKTLTLDLTSATPLTVS